MLAMLQIIIGIVFTMLLFSLLASTMMELIAGFLSLRGQQLVLAIRGMIGGSATAAFIRHPFFQQLAAGSRERTELGGKKQALPSYITGKTFSAILLDLMEIDSKEELEAAISRLPEGPSKELAQFLYRQTDGSLVDFKIKLEQWFNEVMDRASGAYKRTSQRWLVSIGLVLAVVFNADVINIYHNLSVNSSLREVVDNAATHFVNTQPAPTAPDLNNPDMAAARQKIGQLVNENIAALESPLGIGWATVDWSKADFWWWLYKVVGWLTTALGVSLGATFWFEALKKLVSLRSSGPPPAPYVQPVTTTTVQQTTNSPASTVMSSGNVLTAPPVENAFENFQARTVSKPPKRRRPKRPRADNPPPKAEE